MKRIGKSSIAVLFVVTAMVGLAATVFTSRTVQAATATVDLKTAAPFAILAGTPNITNTGASVITG